MNNAVIVDFKRTAFTLANKGELKDSRPDDFLGKLVRAIVNSSKVKEKDIVDLIAGCAYPEGEQGLNIARIAVFLSSLPNSVAGVTVNRFCASSMYAIQIAASNIFSGIGDLYLATGVESMSKISMVGMNPLPHPELFKNYPQAYEAMGITAENLAKKYKIKRDQQDEFALNSHKKAINAQNKGYFLDEIVTIDNISKDGCIRDANIESLSNLDPVFLKKGTVTAGTSSPLTDGASAVMVASEKYADKNKLNKIARIKSFAVSGCDPEIMGIGPVEACNKALKMAGLKMSDIDIIELNEAFAAQALAVIKELKLDIQKVNIDGGAIALGHPLGASGARIVGKAASILKRENKKYALATMCVGGGQGAAVILEKI